MMKQSRAVTRFVHKDESHCWQDLNAAGGFTLNAFVSFLRRYEDRPKGLRVGCDSWDLNFDTHTLYLLYVLDANNFREIDTSVLEALFWILDGAGFRLALVIHDSALNVTTDVPCEQIALWADQGSHGVPWLVEGTTQKHYKSRPRAANAESGSPALFTSSSSAD